MVMINPAIIQEGRLNNHKPSTDTAVSVIFLEGSILKQLDYPNHIDLLLVLYLDKFAIDCVEAVPLVGVEVVDEDLYAFAEVGLEVELDEVGLLLQVVGVVVAGQLDGLGDVFLLHGQPLALLDDVHGLLLLRSASLALLDLLGRLEVISEKPSLRHLNDNNQA